VVKKRVKVKGKKDCFHVALGKSLSLLPSERRKRRRMDNVGVQTTEMKSGRWTKDFLGLQMNNRCTGGTNSSKYVYSQLFTRNTLYCDQQWRSYRGFRRFNEPGPPSSWGPPSQATKKLKKKIIGILLKKN